MKEFDRLAFSPLETAELLGMSRNGVYDAIREGEIEAVRIGGKILVSADKLRARLAGSKAA